MRTLDKYSLIAPCGINCAVCVAYLREKNKCPGCRIFDAGKPISRIKCKIKSCLNLKKNNIKLCFICKDFPCGKLDRLDKRYRSRYNMSPVDNLIRIRETGIKNFLRSEKAKWSCTCGGTVCVHKGYCFDCGKKSNL